MTIKEVEEKTGLSRSNIRFYEKEKLLNPARNAQNGYRNYSEKDVEEIRRIVFFRGIGLTVEEILKLQEGTLSLKTVLKEKKVQLEEQERELKRAQEICGRMLKNQEASYQKVEIEKYVQDLGAFMEERQKIWKRDSVRFIAWWSSTQVWILLTALCLVTALGAFPFLPEKIPVQWSQGTAVSMADKLVVFVYPAACILIRFLLRPFIVRWIQMRAALNEAAADYLTNFLCFAAWSVEGFTVLYVFGILTRVSVVAAADAIVFIGILYLFISRWNREK